MPDTTTPKRLSRRTFLLGGGAGFALLAGGGATWALDRFVVDHVAIDDVAAYEAAQGVDAVDTSTADGTFTGTSYSSEYCTIDISTVVTGSGDSTVTYFVADVVLTDATVLRSAFADNEFGTNIVEDTSVIAAAHDAVFAVNGDYYGFRETGIVVRNGVAYRDAGARDGLAFYRDGSVQVYDETATSADELVAAGVWNTLSFGPAIVQAGAVVDGIEDVEVDTNVGNHSIQGDQPRTGIGVIDANHLVFVVVDGRSEGYSEGVSLPELAAIFTGLGCVTAYNLDGGGSSTMVFHGSLVNDPLGRGQERGTSDVLYIGG
ncbi:phosphodiester glycosidase family protein [Modestobacter versicolor]|uniref:Exopolysaccharide biosynthesis protein n=1 Tax=Modestobacter versicolor TaxID=429133 RepID=A0A323V5H8_9ACTN|nr:phosphodiester glycosidase family protein [Modestobacter versicolor]MBB3676328.1 exopolysaccharide biosynthesis protein [Modestobacter versicolor]PZA20127.1 phosphodiester glycosidase family protein [Modestobacter versicolor]